MGARVDGALLEGKERERFVEGLFDRIAAPYDRLNRVISFGRHDAWRRRLVQLSGCRPASHVCDLGTGTGDLAMAFSDAVTAGGVVIAGDLSHHMLDEAARKCKQGQGAHIHLVRANAAHCPLEDSWADIASMGWVLRNVGDREAVFREVLRLLKPGGRFLSVDMSRPSGPLARAGFWIFRHLIMPPLVLMFGGDSSAYSYLVHSTDRFPDARELKREMSRAGFLNVRHETLMGGAVAIHVGEAPLTSDAELPA